MVNQHVLAVINIMNLVLLSRFSSAFVNTIHWVAKPTVSMERNIQSVQRSGSCNCQFSTATPPDEAMASSTRDARNKSGINYDIEPPWSDPSLDAIVAKKKRDNTRFRQHVNPLARQYQLPTKLPTDWPACVYDDLSRPLHLDIGCGKGGYLLDLSRHEQNLPQNYNYLGLEIRPAVAAFAQQRIARHSHAQGCVAFVGCNANVDLKRVVDKSCGSTLQLARVTIQFPDPHFKTQHQKRRVVSSEFVSTLASLMPTGGEVFLQSDVLSVLHDMRQRFRDNILFDDAMQSTEEFFPHNLYEVPTERELSVLARDLPVYRALFRRNAVDDK